MFRQLGRLMGGKGRGSLGAALSGAQEIFQPTGRRAAEELEQQHQKVLPAPTPGDRLLGEGLLVLPPRPEVPDPRPEGPDPEGEADPPR